MNELPNEFNLPYPDLLERIRYIESEMLLPHQESQFKELRAARSNMLIGILRQRRWWEEFDRWNCEAERAWGRNEFRRERAMTAIYAAHNDMPLPVHLAFSQWLVVAGEAGVASFCDGLLNRLDNTP